MANVRGRYTPGFKRQAVQMMTDHHLRVVEVARRLGHAESPLEDANRRRRAENKRLGMGLDILKQNKRRRPSPPGRGVLRQG